MDWQTIFKHLKKQGFDVYPLGKHEGKCTSPYLVLRNNGAILNQSLVGQEYEILLYYPRAFYGRFEGYIERVKTAMNALYPALKLEDAEQPHYLDDEVEGYMTGLVYRVWKPHKINRV